MQAKNSVFASILMLALMVAPSASWAGVVWTIIDPEFDVTLGGITFPTLTGDSAAGVEFSFEGFTQADITSISWTLQSSPYAVTALDLHALEGDADCALGQNCSNSSLFLSQDSWSANTFNCSAGVGVSTCVRISLPASPASFVLVATPEPSTWAMMLVGFAGLGFAGYRTSRRAAA
jgi:hypothetical protein